MAVVVASKFNYIPSTKDGCTVTAAPQIIRCNHFVATGSDGTYNYGYNCDAVFASQTALLLHKAFKHNA